MNKTYYYLNEARDVLGPVSAEALNELLKVGVLGATAQICEQGTETWLQFSDVFPDAAPTTKTVGASSPNAATSPPTITGTVGTPPTTSSVNATPPATRQPQAAASGTGKNRHLKWILLGAGALLLFLGIAVVLGVRSGYRDAMASQLIQQADQIAFNNPANQDWDKAVSLLKEAVAMGSPEAEYKLGSCYFYGRGVSQDTEQAVRLYRDAAEGGYADAQFNLAMCYQNGTGVSRDETEMLKWLRLAAEQDLPQAELCLGQLYLFGKSVPQDQEGGIGLITSAANQGFAQAQYDLGLTYMVGDGVPKDLIEAAKWIILAKCEGLTASPEVIQEIQSQLTTEQLDTAERMADEWQRARKNPQ